MRIEISISFNRAFTMPMLMALTSAGAFVAL